MKKISDSETLKVLESNFLKVFKNKDPFDNAYTDSIQAKLLLFPTDGYYLQEEQFNVLCQAISRIGEDKFFTSEIEGDCFSTSLSSDSYEYGHWIGEISSTYEDYTNIPIVLENAIYSTSGNWGVIISHEGHAVLGGSKELIKKIQTIYPHYETCKQRFIEYWEHNQREYNSNIDWVHDFLKQFS
ncbi:hypothetical protein ASL14_02635 [Paenibacillus sp. IHB B 3084]|uniref:hypothetical protein n=1 Tax=Paenibacillus sp. IHB B 3084 TaxID=867076 RepID=UPI00071F6391|nr:hypothetical protein [Paenibacillus sp. IHB B 3084]ALP35240.1 hypothetical protein ASL14_02635 [Paenibacillus sp. IHB B 3084]